MTKGKTKNTPHQKGHPKQKWYQDHAILSKWYADALGLALILLLGTLIYSNSFNYSFHLDDLNSIVKNTKVQDVSNIKELWNYSQTRFVPYFT